MNIREQKIESLLFYKNEPVTFLWLAKTLDVTAEDITTSLSAMAPYYEGRGITLVCTDDSAALMSSMSSREIITELDKKGEAKELSKQALETLSIIAYKAKVTKAEIDFIRGVNSVFILRNLLVRGLITKKNNILDKRSPLYIVTHDLLAHLGIEGIEQLPGHLKISQRLNELEDEFNQEQNHSEIIEVGDSSAH